MNILNMHALQCISCASERIFFPDIRRFTNKNKFYYYFELLFISNPCNPDIFERNYFPYTEFGMVRGFHKLPSRPEMCVRLI